MVVEIASGQRDGFCAGRFRSVVVMVLVGVVTVGVLHYLLLVGSWLRRAGCGNGLELPGSPFDVLVSEC